MHEMENLLRLCFVSLCQRVALTSASRGVITKELMQAPGVAMSRKVRSLTHWQHDQTSKAHHLAALEQPRTLHHTSWQHSLMKASLLILISSWAAPLSQREAERRINAQVMWH